MIFEKCESTGNDFLIATMADLEYEGITISPEGLSAVAQKVCDRHFGIGADGLLLLDEPGNDRAGFGLYEKSDDAHCRMYLVNADGSHAEMSGNGSRCFSAYAAAHGYGTHSGDSHKVIMETLAGIKSVVLTADTRGTLHGDVDMGIALTEPAEIPLLADNSLDVPTELLGKMRQGIAVNSGVPHWVLVLDSHEELESPELAPQALLVRFDERFPNTTNVSVVVVDSDERVTTRVFERGADETLSCGTGATAIAAALHGAGLTKDKVSISLRGGDLTVALQGDGTWLLGGPVRKIARCEFDL